MRDLLIKRLKELKDKENNFSKGLMKYNNVYHNNTHISELNFNTLNNNELLTLFERIVRIIQTPY